MCANTIGLSIVGHASDERQGAQDFEARSGLAFFVGAGLGEQSPYDFCMPAKPAAKTADTAAAKAAARTTGSRPRPRRAAAAAQALPVDPAARVLRRFRSVFNAVKTHFKQVEKQAGVGGAQLWALSVIQARPDIGVGDLAAAMDIHQTTASNLLRSMVTAGLVVSNRDGPDRRATHLRLTPAGTRVLKKAPGPFAGVLPGALAALDAQTLARLDEDLGKLLDKLQADERAAGIPLAQM